MQFGDLLAHAGVEEVARAPGPIRVHGVPRWLAGGDDRRRGPGRRRAVRGVLLRRAPAPDLQWHIPSTAIDPVASPALAAFLEPRRRRGHHPRVRPPGLLGHVAAGRRQPGAGRPRRRRAARRPACLRDRHRPGAHPAAVARPPPSQPRQPPAPVAACRSSCHPGCGARARCGGTGTAPA